jgi:hypothetical protein
MRAAALLLAAGLALPAAARAATGGAAVSPELLLVVGAPGAPEYASRFQEAATRWQRTGQRAGARIQVIGLASPGTTPDRQRLQAALSGSAAPAGAAPLWLVFIGHGSYDGRTARFNLRGPDVAAPELAAWLKPVTRPLVFVNGASASAPFLRALTGPGRVIVTATKTGGEVSAPRFGAAFAEAIGDLRADLDRDGGVSVLEAFLQASKRVEASFAEEGLLASEHALLEDNGDGLGTAASFFRGLTASQQAAGGAARDGDRARQITLVPAPPDLALPPALRRRRDELEAAIFALREQRPQLPEATYFARLERLLLPLARLYRNSGSGAGSGSGSGSSSGRSPSTSGNDVQNSGGAADQPPAAPPALTTPPPSRDP